LASNLFWGKFENGGESVDLRRPMSVNILENNYISKTERMVAVSFSL